MRTKKEAEFHWSDFRSNNSSFTPKNIRIRHKSACVLEAIPHTLPACSAPAVFP